MTDFQLKDLASSCLKKIRYSTEQTALEAINRVHKKRKTDLRIYFCKHLVLQVICKISHIPRCKAKSYFTIFQKVAFFRTYTKIERRKDSKFEKKVVSLHS